VALPAGLGGRAAVVVEGCFDPRASSVVVELARPGSYRILLEVDDGSLASSTFVELAVQGSFMRGDGNGDAQVNIADAIFTLSYLFASAGPLPVPFGGCGTDPTPDQLGCGNFPPCDGP
jgi:hypothetical protein